MPITTAALILAALHIGCGVVFMKTGGATERTMRFLVAFSAGTLLAVSIAHLLPEATEALAERSGYAILAGFFALWAVEHLVGSHEHSDEIHVHDGHTHEHSHVTGLSVLTSLVLVAHGLVDGLALASVAKDNAWDDAMLIGLAAHAPALMLALVTLLRLSRLGTKGTLAVITAAGAVIPAGVFAGLSLPGHLVAGGVPQFQGGIAGALIYLSTHHLLPAVEHGKKDRLGIYGLALLGAALTLALVGYHAHSGH